MSRSSVRRVALVLGLTLSLGATAAMAQGNPPFVARTEALNPIGGGCGYTTPLIAMYPDGSGVISYRLTATGDYTLDFDSTGHAELTHTGGNNARWKDLTLLPDSRFLLVLHQRNAEQLLASRHDPPAFPTWAGLAGDEGSMPVVDAGPGSAEPIAAWVVDSPAAGIVARRITPAGTPTGGLLPVAALAGEARGIDVTKSADGSFVVYWEDWIGASAGSSLWLRRFDAAGAPLAPAQLVASEAPDQGPFLPNAFRADDGAAAVVYTDPASASLRMRVLEKETLGEPFDVWSRPLHPATRAKGAFLGDGDLAVAAEIHFDNGAGSIHLLRFGRDGQQVGSRVEVQLPGLSYRSLIDPQIAAAGDRVAVLYQVRDNEMDCQLRMRLFDATLFADGFESGDLAAWTGAP